MRITNKQTGELIRLDQLKPRQFQKILLEMADENISDMLSTINLTKRIYDKAEKLIKKFIKENKELDFNGDGEASFDTWRIYSRY